MTKEEIHRLKMLGRAAHDAGKMRAPATDALVMQEVADLTVGGSTVDIFTLWLDGWDEARTEYMERMEAMRWEPYTEGMRP